MRTRAVLQLVILCCATAACSDVTGLSNDVQFELGLLQADTLVGTVSVPANSATSLSLAILVTNKGPHTFRYSGTMTSSFADNLNLSTKKEFRGFEVQPGERKNIGTVDVAVLDRAPSGTRYTVRVQFNDAGPHAVAETTIVVE